MGGTSQEVGRRDVRELAEKVKEGDKGGETDDVDDDVGELTPDDLVPPLFLVFALWGSLSESPEADFNLVRSSALEADFNLVQSSGPTERGTTLVMVQLQLKRVCARTGLVHVEEGRGDV